MTGDYLSWPWNRPVPAVEEVSEEAFSSLLEAAPSESNRPAFCLDSGFDSTLSKRLLVAWGSAGFWGAGFENSAGFGASFAGAGGAGGFEGKRLELARLVLAEVPAPGKRLGLDSPTEAASLGFQSGCASAAKEGFLKGLGLCWAASAVCFFSGASTLS